MYIFGLNYTIMKILDQSLWKRKEHFDFFLSMTNLILVLFLKLIVPRLISYPSQEINHSFRTIFTNLFVRLILLKK